MPAPVVVSFPHKAGADKARESAKEALQKLVSQYGASLSRHSVVWTGNHADIEVGALGMTFRGTIDITDETVTVTVQIPMLLAPWRGRIESFLQSNANALGLPKPANS